MDRLIAFVAYCEFIGVRPSDNVKLDACRPLGGDAEIYIQLGDLKAIVTLLEYGLPE